MSETDIINMNNVDFSSLQKDMDKINDALTVLTYTLYYLAGATTVIVGGVLFKLSTVYCIKKKNKVVELSEESISLLSNKIDELDEKVAVAIKKLLSVDVTSNGSELISTGNKFLNITLKLAILLLFNTCRVASEYL